jgi:hypothetical protein
MLKFEEYKSYRGFQLRGIAIVTKNFDGPFGAFHLTEPALYPDSCKA